MIRQTHTRSLILVTLVSGLVGAGHAARAQVGKVVIRAQQPATTIKLNDNTFNQWALGPGTTPETIHQRLEQLLDRRIEQLDETCKLTEAQTKRLHLAGQGDIKRLHDRLEEKRRAIVDVAVERARLNDVLRELQPLRVAVQADPFEEGSIFSKVLKSTLDPSQAERYREDAAERLRFRHRESIDVTVALFDRVAGLGSEQRSRFATLMRENTQPPKRSGSYDYYVMLFQLSQIPEGTIRPLFEAEQWKALRLQVDRARALEKVLRDGGYLPDPPAPDLASGSPPTAEKD